MSHTLFGLVLRVAFGFCGSVCILLVTFVAAPAAPAAPPEASQGAGEPAIVGIVSDADREPIAGATVMIWTAAPRRGYSNFCPSCYADCGKRATTDANGSFSFERVDPTLRFELVVVRAGFASLEVSQVVPYGSPVVARLKARKAPTDASHVVRGRVVDAAGHPIVNALIAAQPFMSAGSALEPLVVSDEHGDFEVAVAGPAKAFAVFVSARGLAPTWYTLPTGPERQTLTLSRGATIRGRLVQFGKPVSDAEVGLFSKDRIWPWHAFPEARIATKADGTFLFTNVPAPLDWVVYAKMDSISGRGATIPADCRTRSDDEVIDVGDIQVVRGNRVRGRAILTDGKPIPSGMQIRISSDEAWDWQAAALPPDGRFDFKNLPTGPYTVTPAVLGYHFSRKNPNLMATIEGRIDRDIDDFVILLDPGPDLRGGIMTDASRLKPLQSAPAP